MFACIGGRAPVNLIVMRLRSNVAALLVGASVSGCATVASENPPAWVTSLQASSCSAIAGSYSDKPTEAWNSPRWQHSRSLANILLSYREVPPNLFGITEPYTSIKVALPVSGGLSFALVGSDGGEALIVLSEVAKCEHGVISVERRSTTSAEGTRNSVIDTLQLLRGGEGQLIVHTSFEVRPFNLPDRSPRHAWYRFLPTK